MGPGTVIAVLVAATYVYPCRSNNPVSKPGHLQLGLRLRQRLQSGRTLIEVDFKLILTHMATAVAGEKSARVLSAKAECVRGGRGIREVSRGAPVWEVRSLVDA